MLDIYYIEFVIANVCYENEFFREVQFILASVNILREKRNNCFSLTKSLNYTFKLSNRIQIEQIVLNVMYEVT